MNPTEAVGKISIIGFDGVPLNYCGKSLAIGQIDDRYYRLSDVTVRTLQAGKQPRESYTRLQLFRFVPERRISLFLEPFMAPLTSKCLYTADRFLDLCEKPLWMEIRLKGIRDMSRCWATADTDQQIDRFLIQCAKRLRDKVAKYGVISEEQLAPCLEMLEAALCATDCASTMPDQSLRWELYTRKAALTITTTEQEKHLEVFYAHVLAPTFPDKTLADFKAAVEQLRQPKKRV